MKYLFVIFIFTLNVYSSTYAGIDMLTTEKENNIEFSMTKYKDFDVYTSTNESKLINEINLSAYITEENLLKLLDEYKNKYKHIGNRSEGYSGNDAKKHLYDIVNEKYPFAHVEISNLEPKLINTYINFTNNNDLIKFNVSQYIPDNKTSFYYVNIKIIDNSKSEPKFNIRDWSTIYKLIIEDYEKIQKEWNRYGIYDPKIAKEWEMAIMGEFVSVRPTISPRVKYFLENKISLEDATKIINKEKTTKIEEDAQKTINEKQVLLKSNTYAGITMNSRYKNKEFRYAGFIGNIISEEGLVKKIQLYEFVNNEKINEVLSNFSSKYKLISKKENVKSYDMNNEKDKKNLSFLLLDPVIYSGILRLGEDLETIRLSEIIYDNQGDTIKVNHYKFNKRDYLYITYIDKTLVKESLQENIRKEEALKKKEEKEKSQIKDL